MDININSSSDEDDNIPSKKIKKYTQHFSPKWLNMFDWLIKKNNRSYCKFCDIPITGSKTHLERHDSSKHHEIKAAEARKTIKIDKMFNNNKEILLQQKIKIAETKLCAFIVEHNLPMRTMDHLTPLLKSIFPDSDIAKGISVGRTKTTGTILNVLKEENFSRILEDLRKYPFSIIADETTDISVSKSMAIVVRYCRNDCLVMDKFLNLIEVESATAESLCNSIKNLLVSNNVPLENLVGFAADHAAVMMGKYHRVQAL